MKYGAAVSGHAEKPLHGGYAGEHPVRLDFSASLNPLGMPACVRRAVAASAASWEHYPDPYCSRLRRLLAERIAAGTVADRQIQADRCTRSSDGSASESDSAAAEHRTNTSQDNAGSAEKLLRRIVIGNGADDLIFRIVQALKPRRALLISPTFSEYEAALRQTGCEIAFYALRPENDFDLTGDFLPAITDEIDLLLLCNPNNPTGRLIDPALLDTIIRRCGDCGVTLVVDECFLPFVPDAWERTALRYLCGVGGAAGAPHVIVLRAFTKIFAMPGIRLGYCVCGSRKMARRIQESGQYWSVSAPALAAGEAIMSDPGLEDYVNQTDALISREREFLDQWLREAGITCIPSRANFILCRSDLPLYELLLADGILIRDCANLRGLETGWYRIAVRTRAENESLCEATAGFRRQFTVF